MVNINKVLIVNLKKRYDRLDRVQKELINSNILKNYTVVEGLDGSLLSNEQIQPYVHKIAYQEILFNQKSKGLYMTRGAAGLAMTYKNILESATENTLVLEDDISIDDNFDELFTNATKDLPENWDMLYVGWHPSRFIKINSISKNIATIFGQINGTHAWAFNHKSVTKLLKVFPIRYQIDTELYKLNCINRYCTINPLVCSIVSKSDIQN